MGNDIIINVIYIYNAQNSKYWKFFTLQIKKQMGFFYIKNPIWSHFNQNIW